MKENALSATGNLVLLVLYLMLNLEYFELYRKIFYFESIH